MNSQSRLIHIKGQSALRIHQALMQTNAKGLPFQMLRLKFNLILKLGTQSSAIIVSGCNCNRLEVDFNLKLEDNCHSGQHLQATLRQRNQLHCLHKDDFVIKDDFDITKDTVLAVTRYPQKTEM